MNTSLKNKILAGAMLFSAMFYGVSCDDSVEGLKVTPETPYADKTLYEVMVNDPDLTDFMEVVNSCGAECADSLFNHSRVYTVWAPVNNSFNKDSLIEEVNVGNRDIVFKTFVMAHVSNFLKPAAGSLEDNYVMLLNDKMAKFEGNYTKGYTFAGCAVDYANIRVLNGILHKIAKASEYRYNIWEYINLAEGIDSVASYLYSFNEYRFNEGQSIKGPIIEGEQTYLDSIFDFNNQWLTPWGGIGNLNVEDSSYTVYFPTNDVWEEQLQKIDKYYNYNRTSKNPVSMDSTYRDSLRLYYPHLNLLKYLTYSNVEQRFVDSPDSIMPVHRSGKRVEFLKAQLERNVISTKELSNGEFKIVDQYPFSPLEICHDTVFMEAENTNMLTGQDEGIIAQMKTAYKNQINKDSTFKGVEISGGAYYQFGDENTKSAVRAEYTIPDILSAKYKLALILVPRNITNSDIKKEDLLPVVLRVTLSQNGKQIKNVNNISIDQTRVDTIFLSDKNGPLVLDMPTCEYYKTWDNKDYTTKVEIRTVRGSKRDMSLRLDKIMFIPVLDEE